MKAIGRRIAPSANRFFIMWVRYRSKGVIRVIGGRIRAIAFEIRAMATHFRAINLENRAMQ